MSAELSWLKVLDIIGLVLIVLSNLGSVASNCTPIPYQNCRAICEWTDGTSITLDISNIGVTFPYRINDVGESDYFIFSPCLGTRCLLLNSFNSTVCQYETNGKVYNCGRYGSNFVNWTLESISPYRFTVSYSGGDCIAEGCKESVFVFEQNIHKEFSVSYTSVNASEYTFIISGNCIGQPNCVIPKDSSISGIIGFVIIFVFLLIVAAYFIVGVLVMRFYKGARGKEMIPNYEFWSDFPSLIVEGCLFVISPCYNTKKYGTYETIKS